MLPSKQFYVIFRGVIIDWYISMENRNKAFGMKIFLGSHYGQRYIEVTTELKSNGIIKDSVNKPIEPFPKDVLNAAIFNMKNQFRSPDNYEDNV